MIKTFSRLGIKVNFLNLIKDIYKKLPANIIHKCEKHVTFPLRSEQDMDVPHLPLLVKKILSILTNKTRPGQEIKCIQMGNECHYLQMTWLFM